MDNRGSSGALPGWGAHLGRFVAFAAIYRLLVGTDDPAEWAAGLVGAALAAAGAALVAGQLPAARVSPGGLARVLALVPRVAIDGVRVALSALAVDVPAGSFEVVPVDPGGDDADSTGRRALLIAGASLAPNGVVVTLDRDRGAMLVHRLLPGGGPAGGGNREWPL